ncbi:GntR family transcriptional regulator [Pelagicoccus mobilis]|uniref:GntR family transcriptional regulator n=1 Tax=Pelagicoccus mobilis TaxID=415221 RepID=A0A934VRY1_9BACT|nr:GntR family transcriptional regulator [Pelagicoccus mobilis]MBK1879877.1 GntR family transcriptional regulator [Pelagicoccus mobilis]
MAVLTDRVKKWIAKDISLGVYPPGSKMPTRMELMQKYNIARASADKVVSQLVAEGLLVSARGSGTYVVDPKNDTPYLYIILNTESECSEANRFHSQLSLMLTKVSGNLEHSMLGSGDLENHFSSILKNVRSHVIWSRPSIKSYGDIATLHRAGVRQVLVNRPIATYNYASTDTRKALADVFEIISSRRQGASFGLVAPPIDLEESFLAERELYFHEMIHEHSGRLNFMGRVSDKSPSEILRVTREALDRVHELDYLFVPDFAMVPFVVALAAERGIVLGKGLNLITIDWDEEREGVICIKQDWDTMLHCSVEWARSRSMEPFQKLVPAEVLA